ncbi:MAG: hypothetical protein LBQ60_16135 [Bacteroidales bacterium]|jgi:hypothetical protein|nr:hypothetical protein [Bacteroidales bacterium]
MERASIFLFVAKRKYLIHSISTLSMGGGIATPPYVWFDTDITDKKLIEELLHVLSYSKTGLPRPNDWDASNKELLQSAGLKRNKDLYTNSLLVNVLKKDDTIEFSSMVNLGRRGFMNKVPEYKITLPANSDLKVLSEALKKAFEKCE